MKIWFLWLRARLQHRSNEILETTDKLRLQEWVIICEYRANCCLRSRLWSSAERSWMMNRLVYSTRSKIPTSSINWVMFHIELEVQTVIAEYSYFVCKRRRIFTNTFSYSSSFFFWLLTSCCKRAFKVKTQTNRVPAQANWIFDTLK
jgi:hypothetical protein